MNTQNVKRGTRRILVVKRENGLVGGGVLGTAPAGKRPAANVNSRFEMTAVHAAPVAGTRLRTGPPPHVEDFVAARRPAERQCHRTGGQRRRCTPPTAATALWRDNIMQWCSHCRWDRSDCRPSWNRAQYTHRSLPSQIRGVIKGGQVTCTVGCHYPRGGVPELPPPRNQQSCVCNLQAIRREVHSQ